ncbi:MAG: hypothetical protein M3P51_08020 [Chloroflexota bacterium]|nr:hypothetical protein [Chloroflexota bacterium]
MHTTSRYISYLRRLWQVSDGRQPVWRAMVEDPRSGEQRGFASPELLFAFLSDQMGRPTDSADTEGGDRNDQSR